MTSKSDPAKDWFDVTPSDTTVYSPALRSLWVNSAGEVAIESTRGNISTFTVVAGGPLPCENIRRVMATNTTGGISLVGLL